MCDRSYPKKLAFQYLEDLKNEFEKVNGNQIETAARPYAFVKFGIFLLQHHFTYFELLFIFYHVKVACIFSHVSYCVFEDSFIQKTKKLYLDTRTQRNLAKLNDELYEVHQIMTRNVQEVLGVGEKLDRKQYIFPFSLKLLQLPLCYFDFFPKKLILCN